MQILSLSTKPLVFFNADCKYMCVNRVIIIILFFIAKYKAPGVF